MTNASTINGHAVKQGCIIDGHWGQYGPDRLADVAEEFGWQPAEQHDDPRAIRANIDEQIAGFTWDQHYWAAEDIEDWLNDNAENCVVAWEDGECFIWTWPDLDDLGEAWVCRDCYFAHHYGRHIHDGEWYAGESDQPCDRKPLGELDGCELTDWTYDASYPDDAGSVYRYGDGNEEFSMHSCDGCGSTLGGSRHRLAIHQS